MNGATGQAGGHRLLILHGEDIAAALAVARDLPDAETCVFDPVLVDRARAAGLPGVRFLPWTDAPDYAALHQQAHEQARALERELDTLAGGADGALGVSIQGWQHLTLYYLFMSLGWYGGLARAMMPALAGRSLHVLLCDNPAIYYFNAFVPALLMLHAAQAEDVPAQAYGYGRKPDDSGQLPRLDGRAEFGGRETLLAHLPTCMYDIGHFNDEFRASGKAVWNLAAKHFSLPVAAERQIGLTTAAQLAEPLPAERQAEIERAAARWSAHLASFFADKIPSASHRQRQVAQLVGVYRAQLQTLALLQRHFAEQRPSKLLLSDHDTGFHGPLLAFAEQAQLPVLMLPHSKTSPDQDFSASNLVALTHPSQGDAVLDAHGRRIRQHALALPVELQASLRMPRPLQRVALMLNALTLGGIYFAQFRPYLDGIRRIADWCEARGLVLDIRCKPSYSLVQLLSTELGLDAERLVANAAVPMAEFAARCDLCLMYDTPTAGALEFLNQGLPILNPVITPLTRAQAVTTHPDVVPRDSIDKALERVAGFVADPVLLQQFRLQQFTRYVQLWQGALPLRSFL